MDDIEKIEKLEQITKEHSKDFEITILYPISTLDIENKGNSFALSIITSRNRKNRILVSNQEDYNLAEKLKKDYEVKYPELGKWRVEYRQDSDEDDFEMYLFSLN